MPGPTPDALMLPTALKVGNSSRARLNRVLDFAEPLLGVKRPARCYVRQQSETELFVTADNKDTLYGHKGTPEEGKPRYRWEDASIPGVEGVRFGYLIDKPAPEPDPAPAPATAPEAPTPAPTPTPTPTPQEKP